MIKWTTHEETVVILVAIAKRAVAMAKKYGIDYEQQDAVMDINACHSNGNPLKLGELLKADNFNFAHDVFGIRQNLDRETGHLQNCFLPRYSSY